MDLKLRQEGDVRGFVERARRVNRKFRIQAGFFPDARYQTGEPVASVAVKNEFGYGNVPARPFMREATHRMRKPLRRALGSQLNARTLSLTQRDAEVVGLVMEDEIRTSIDTGNWAPNSPQTIARKGSDKPLIDTGFMRMSVASKVVRG